MSSINSIKKTWDFSCRIVGAVCIGAKAAEVGIYSVKTAWNFTDICIKNRQLGVQAALVAGGLISAIKLVQSGVEWNLDPRKIRITDGKKLAVAATLAVASAAVIVNNSVDFQCALQGKKFSQTYEGCL